MSKLQTPKHRAVRSVLRISGPIIAAVGLLFIIIGVANFFAAFGGNNPPRLFWCIFVGIPLLFVGGTMSMFGFLGAMARYTAAEHVPVATDAISDITDATQGSVKSLARAVAEGAREGLQDPKRSSQHPDTPSV